jgi:hypothetical protein
MAAHYMTVGLWRWTRRCEPHDLSRWLAAVRRYRSENLGTIEVHLLGQAWVRKMVALALLLAHQFSAEIS